MYGPNVVLNHELKKYHLDPKRHRLPDLWTHEPGKIMDTILERGKILPVIRVTTLVCDEEYPYTPREHSVIYDI